MFNELKMVVNIAIALILVWIGDRYYAFLRARHKRRSRKKVQDDTKEDESSLRTSPIASQGHSTIGDVKEKYQAFCDHLAMLEQNDKLRIYDESEAEERLFFFRLHASTDTTDRDRELAEKQLYAHCLYTAYMNKRRLITVYIFWTDAWTVYARATFSPRYALEEVLV